MKTWMITGVSSGFGREMARQLLAQGDRVIGTVRKERDAADLLEERPDAFRREILDVTDTEAVHRVTEAVFAEEPVDVIVSNAGYGLFGAAEELSDEDIDRIIATNLTGSIQFIRSALPYFRRQRTGRIIQISSYGGQVAYAGNSLYHAVKFGIEGFCESVAQEMVPFGVGVTIVEPGGARTDFRYRSAHVAHLMAAYDGNPAHAFLNMLDPANGLAPGDPARMAAAIIESAGTDPAPLRLVLGAHAWEATVDTLRKRLADIDSQKESAAAADFPKE